MGNLLNLSTNFIDFTVESIGAGDLNWLAKIIQGLISGVGIIGVGIILFTIILKTIVLPLDIYSRYKMKKQSLLMKAMRPDMEKLQKQYANDKQMYNQKVMELQKANGISVFGACLPMIVSLVIFMFVFSAFSSYSQYANLYTFVQMGKEYNDSVTSYVLCEKTDYDKNAALYDNDDEKTGFLVKTVDPSVGTEAYLVHYGKFEKFVFTSEGRIKDELFGENTAERYTELNIQKKYEELKDRAKEFKDLTIEDFEKFKEEDKQFVVRELVREEARKASAKYYREHTTGFLWVKNIWYPDSPLNKEVPNFSGFSSSVTRVAGRISQNSYDEVTYYLRNTGYLDGNHNGGTREGKQVNGYFVLIVLAIGLMFLQQFISMRSQKDANELSTVDGSGARTNKWMLIMMPLIYGIFSFFYSAAFSIYMITNTIYSLIMTVVLNKIMDVKFAKKMERGELFKKKKTINNRKRLK